MIDNALILLVQLIKYGMDMDALIFLVHQILTIMEVNVCLLILQIDVDLMNIMME